MTLKQTVSNDRIKLGAWMREHYPALTMSHLQKLCRTGQIRVGGRRATPSTPLLKGDEVKLPPFIGQYEGAPAAAKKTAFSPADIKQLLASIIYEDDEVIVIDKPAGLATQGGTKISKHVDELVNAALPQYEGSRRLVHRIDKDTSGALVIAKGYEAARQLTSMFRERTVKKSYLALVYGSLVKKSGIIDAPLVDEKGERKRAVTNYKVLDEAFGTVSLVELSPLTGRTHQLRQHMAGIGHPIVGDFKYGSGDRFAHLKNALGIDMPRQLMLHSWRVGIEGKKTIEAKMPAHMLAVCEYLNLRK
jgi:23S rRNA pseudouridine955/2504/2580 synthase